MKYIITAVLFFFFSFLFSQQGEVLYNYTESLTIGNAVGEQYHAYLRFDEKSAEYVVKRDDLESKEDINTQRTFLNPHGAGGYISSGLMVIPNGFQVITDVKANMIYSNIFLRTPIYVQESIPEIKWDIHPNEKKEINGYACSKAIANFRGRNFIVWFTSEIPFKFGPWKLSGLPGLILEAYDEDKYVYWTTKSIKYIPQENIIINRYLINESGNIQKDFLSIKEYRNKLNSLIQSMNVNNVLRSSSIGATPNAITMGSLFIEIFEDAD